MKAALTTYTIGNGDLHGNRIGTMGEAVYYSDAKRVIEELEATIEKKDKDILKLTEIIANAISEGSLKIAKK